MPTRRTLLGLGTGAAVALSLMQSGKSASAQTGDNGWGVPSLPEANETLNVSISKIEPSDMRAPVGVTFVAEVQEAVNFTPATGAFSSETDLNFLLPEYYWHVESGVRSTFSAIEKVVDPLFARGDRGIGPHFSPTFVTAGVHKVVLYAYFPDGSWGREETTVTVTAHDLGYTEANTILIDGTGQFNGAPAAQSANQVTTFAAASARAVSLVNSGVTDVRVLLNPDDDLLITAANGNAKFDVGLAGLEHFRMEPWDRTAQVTLDMQEQTGTVFDLKDATGLQSFKCSGMRFLGGYDAVLEVGLRPNFILTKINNVLTDIVFDNTADVGIKTLLNCGNGNQTGSLYVNNHDSFAANDYLTLWPADTGILSFTGCSAQPAMFQSAGSRPKNGLGVGAMRDGNVHHGIRAGGDKIYIVGNTFAGRHGWGTGYFPTNNNSIRLGRNNPTNMYAIVARNLLETGSELQEGGNGDINPRHVLFEQNYNIINELYARCFTAKSGNTTFRNNIILKHNIAVLDGSATWASVTGGVAANLRPGGQNDPFFIYGNTLVDLLNDTRRQKQVDFVSTNGWNHVFESNNLRHEPNMTGGVAHDVDTTPLGFDSEMPGIIVNYVKYEGSLPQIAPNASVEIPYSGNFMTFAGDQLGQSDFSGIDLNPERHVLEVETEYTANSGSVSLNFGTSGQVTVTNLTGVTWATGARIRLALVGGNADLTLTSDLADGASVVVANPNNRASDPNGDVVRYTHNMRYFQGTLDAFVLEATASGIRITNTQAAHIPASDDVRIIVDTGDNQMAPLEAFKHPAGSVSLYRPNAPIAATAGLLPLHDFVGSPRAGVHPSTPDGVASMGAT